MSSLILELNSKVVLQNIIYFIISKLYSFKARKNYGSKQVYIFIHFFDTVETKSPFSAKKVQVSQAQFFGASTTLNKARVEAKLVFVSEYLYQDQDVGVILYRIMVKAWVMVLLLRSKEANLLVFVFVFSLIFAFVFNLHIF